MTDRQPPNYRDEACGFGHAAPSTPDVVGTLYGLRGFGLTDDGWLRGCTFAVPWGPGWNTAACLVTRRIDGPVPHRPAFSHPFWGRVHDANSGCVFPLTPDDPVEYEDGWNPDPCKGIDPRCGCGFYAYYDEQSGRTNAYGNIRGVIEAAGKCVVGPKGFRAGRARIVAVVRPKVFKPRTSGVQKREIQSLNTLVKLLEAAKQDTQVRPWFGGTNRFGILWGTAVVALALIGKGATDTAALLGAVGIVTTLVGVLTAVSRHRTRRLIAQLDAQIAEGKAQVAGLTEHVDFDEVMALVAEHYPDVKVYDSMAACIADYPPSDVRGLLGIEFTEGGVDQ